MTDYPIPDDKDDPLQAHTCKVHGPSRPTDRPRYASEDSADYSLRAEMGER